MSPVGVSPDPRRPWVPTPFTRLARTHALSVAGDTLFTAAMAGTVFFSVTDFDAARGRVALLLVFTIAPFAVAAPLLGPLLDRARGGRRWMILGIAVARAVLCVLIIWHRDLWLFYVEALLFLVLSKGYLIARGAVVPTTVHNDAELVTANSRLALLSGVTAVLAGGPAIVLLWLGGSSWVLGLAAVLFVGCALAAAQLPATRVASAPADAVEIAELRSTGILVAATSMGAVRFIVGFLVFQVGFYAKDNDQGLLIVFAAIGAQAGFLIGSLGSPVLRRRFSEERILAIALAVTIAVGLVSVLIGLAADGSAVTLGAGATLLSMAVGATSNVGKQAFDALVQRDAPDANRGRSFARFETRFQLIWVFGALLPTAVVLPMEVSFALVCAVAAFALLSYLVGRQRAAAGRDHRLVRLPPLPRRRRRADGQDAVTAGAQRRRADSPAGAGSTARVARRRRSGPDRRRVVPPVGTGSLPDWPTVADLPPVPPTPASTGRLGLDDDDTVPTPQMGDPESAALFGAGGEPLHRPVLDPRVALDPTVSVEGPVVDPTRDLGFLDDPDGSPGSRRGSNRRLGLGRRRRSGRRRRRSDRDQPLPGFDDFG